MIIHVIGSLEKEEDTRALRKIVELTYDAGAVLATDWVEPAIATAADNRKWQFNIDDDIEAIKQADIVIIEATHYDFNQGFQAGAALDYKKPVLVLSRTPISGKILSWITDDLLVKKEYSSDAELEKIVTTFIQQNKITTKDLRFNFFIDRSIHSFLEEVSRETGKNKSEIIRDAIARGINEDRK